MRLRGIVCLSAVAGLLATQAACDSQRTRQAGSPYALPRPSYVRNEVGLQATIPDSADEALLRQFVPVGNPRLGHVLRAGTDSLVFDESVWGELHGTEVHGRVLGIDPSGLELGLALSIYVALDEGDTLQLLLYPREMRAFKAVVDSLAEGDSVIARVRNAYSSMEVRSLRRVRR